MIQIRLFSTITVSDKFTRLTYSHPSPFCLSRPYLVKVKYTIRTHIIVSKRITLLEQENKKTANNLESRVKMSSLLH